jgi:hypothetical protein
MEKQLNTKRLSERPRRSPLSGKSRLDIKDRDPNYVYRIVNVNLESDPDRVQDLMERGYEIVSKDNAGQVGDKRVDNPSALGSAGQISVGKGTKAIVMRIPREWYDEDQKIKQQEVDATEARADKRADYGSQVITNSLGNKPA